jgi:hypothetical protein
MKKSTNAGILPLALVFLLAVIDGSTHIASAQSVTVKRQVEIDVFSGRPNPVFTLNDAEATLVQRWLTPTADALAKVDSASPLKTPESVLPSKLGYRGIVITEYAADGRVLSRTEIAGKSVLARSTGQLARLTTPSDDVERKLVDLALAKATIDSELHWLIQEEIGKRAKGATQ